MAVICGHLETGVFRRDAAALVNIDEGTFSRWYSRGSHDDERGIYREFYLAVNKSEAQMKLSASMTLQAGAAQNPKLLLSWLGRRFPAQYGRKDNVEEIRPEDQAASTQQLRDELLEMAAKLAPEPEEPTPAPVAEVPADAQ